MGWIVPTDKMPPEGLEVLVEVSGHVTGAHGEWLVSDHAFYIATWLHPVGHDNGEWFFHDSEIFSPVVHAWMPLPRHFELREIFKQRDDLMEHAMFEKDPEWLYKGDAVYEQMSLEDFMGGNK